MAFPTVAVGAGAVGLGALSSLFGASKRKAMPSLNELRSMFGTGALSRDTMSLYNMLAGSPQFRNALNVNALAGSNLSRGVSAGLGRRGLTTTGIGTIASSIGGSAAQFGESALRGGLFGQAGNMAQANMSQLLEAYMGTLGMQAQQQNPWEMFGASLLTGGSALLTQPKG